MTLATAVKRKAARVARFETVSYQRRRSQDLVQENACTQCPVAAMNTAGRPKDDIVNTDLL